MAARNGLKGRFAVNASNGASNAQIRLAQRGSGEVKVRVSDMPLYALLCFHLRSDELKAWRLALRLDSAFAKSCLSRINFVIAAQANDSDLTDARYSLGDDWPERVRVLQVQGDPNYFDAELDALDKMVMVHDIPSFARDVTDPDDHIVSLAIGDHGIWIDYTEDYSGPTHAAEFVTRAQLEEVLAAAE